MDFHCIEAWLELPEFRVINQVISPQHVEFGARPRVKWPRRLSRRLIECTAPNTRKRWRVWKTPSMKRRIINHRRAPHVAAK